MWRFELADVVPSEDESVAWVYCVRKEALADGDTEETPCVSTVLRKNLVHLTRVRDHAAAKGLDPPALGATDRETRRESVHEFLCWVSDRLKDGSLSSLDAEVQQFARSSLPKEETWGLVDEGTRNAPKVRRVFVDISVMGGSDLVGGPLEPFYSLGSDPDSFFVTLSHGVQRFCSDVVRSPIGCPKWTGQDATFTIPSVADWIDCTVMCLGGLMGAPILVGVARIPVFALMSPAASTLRDFPLVDVRTAKGVRGVVTLAMSAHFLASRCHLHARGTPASSLPIRIDTGDMIFFKSKRILASTTRLLTWSDWDHVAVVIGGKRLRLLESVSDVGVVLRDLDPTLELYKGGCSQIGIRRLQLGSVVRTPIMTERALRYAQETRGIPYNWSIPDMITTSTERKPAAAMFCSQLVVEVLRKVEIVDDSVIADNYLPGTLADVKKSQCVPADPMIRFSGWEGESTNPEHPFVQMAHTIEFPFGKQRACLNAAWKGRSTGSSVTVVGTEADFGLLVLDDGSKVPAAFVDAID